MTRSVNRASALPKLRKHAHQESHFRQAYITRTTVGDDGYMSTAYLDASSEYGINTDAVLCPFG